MTQTEILTTLSASGPRRVFGVTVFAVLGLVLLWIVFRTPPASLGLMVVLLVLGIASLFGAMRMWSATERSLHLTERGLELDTGEMIAPWDDIAKVERGMLAFKPSNGFLVTRKAKAPRAWAPGLYWQMGRRIGVGGVTTAAQGKLMADIIAMRLAEGEEG
ncbi:hypothetical protein [Pseudaestuariivita sp.]|uniref:hypothetical protein n=1 Tax=Pseudaestuariivita sp. TaxID=2211669 RepID=UPI0040582558